MQTVALNPENKNSIAQCERLPLLDGEVYFKTSVFDDVDSQSLFNALYDSTAWQQQRIRMFGKSVLMPRLVAWHADTGIHYRYSGHTAPHNDWTPALLRIKSTAENICNCTFNGALLNLYRNGNDSLSWHSDDEYSLGAEPTIASFSFGCTRLFQMKHKTKTIPIVNLELTPGSLLVMLRLTQKHWKHCIPKNKNVTGPRINVTFRSILDSST